MEIDSSKPIFFNKPGDAVLENSVLLSFLELTDSFNPVTNFKVISEISRVIESFVFYERLFVFDYVLDNDNREAYFISENPLPLADIIEKLSKEKILNLTQVLPFDYVPQPSVLLKQINKSRIIPVIKLKSFNETTFPYYLYQQEIARKVKNPFISSDDEYVQYFIKGSQNYKFNLANKLVSSINSNVTKQFTELLKNQHNIEFIIPPFLSIVLNNVVKGASFGEAILDLRDEFSGIRKLFFDYNIQFYDSSNQLKDQIKFANKIFSDIETIARKFSIIEKTRYKIWSDSFDFILDSVAINDFNVIDNANLLSRLLKLSKEMINELLLRYRYNSVYKMKKDFYQIKEYSSLLQKAIEPSIKQSKKFFKKTGGRICIIPGNPFREVPRFKNDKYL